jgi:hypothetical protein
LSARSLIKIMVKRNKTILQGKPKRVDREVDEAWAHEVERRISEIESGRARLVPAAQAIARARVAFK